jgi:hypothetical protein
MTRHPYAGDGAPPRLQDWLPQPPCWVASWCRDDMTLEAIARHKPCSIGKLKTSPCDILPRTLGMPRTWALPVHLVC